jgi:hypothetical protein
LHSRLLCRGNEILQYMLDAAMKPTSAMNKKFVFPGLCLFLILGSALYFLNPEGVNAASSLGEKTLVLYDAAGGAIPRAPLMSFTDFPQGGALPTYLDGTTVMDTTTFGRETYAGWTSSEATTPGFPSLDRTAGFQLDFTLQIEDESHRNNNRAGFSLIALSDDARGIELAFWENEIWVQSDNSTGGLFKHGEGVVFPTTTDLIDYRLTIIDDAYTLTANTQPILSGPVHDYNAFDGFPDPYETPNFLFLGDDTTSAQARIQLRFLSVTGTEPVVPTGTSTSTSTSSPLPTVSFTPPPIATPVPSPTPTGNIVEFCSSGWIFLAVMITNAMMLKNGKGKSKT